MFLMRFAIFLAASMVLACSLSLAEDSAPPTGKASGTIEQHPGFIGSKVCAGCHGAESRLWRESDHASAMLEVNEVSVLAPFKGETFEKDGIKSTFFRRGGRFYVNTDGPDGKMADFEVRYTFGISPLQQYLISLPGGRYQALGIAWDTRPASEGGHRWFSLYPDLKLEPGDPLHWTGLDQNWNYQCAWCHSTDLKKNFDASRNTFATTWSEINVGCEACHGPGAAHVAWARTPEDARSEKSGGDGLAIHFDERAGVHWTPTPHGTASRSGPRRTDKEINVCAGCHARRGQFSDVPRQTATFLDAFRPALIEPGLYYADGQQRDEVYKYGSFLQSKMYAAGVTCSDCHDPHSGRTVLEGNALCSQCHDPARFDAAAHHHHEPNTAGAQCVSCHMPATNYMIIDARHDHSLRIPRPDLTVSLSIPNACNRCHADRDAQWAVDRLHEWYGHPLTGMQDFAALFSEADEGAPGSREALIAYLQEKEHPAIVTASALDRLAARPNMSALKTAAGKLASKEPLVRDAAISIIRQAPPEARLKLLGPLLEDQTRLVRMDAANALAGPAEAMMDDATRKRFEGALAEYVEGQLFDSDRPEANANLASLDLRRGNVEEAKRYYETAIQRDPSFAPAVVGLAEILRRDGQEDAAQKLLREALAGYPDSAVLCHALGLSLVRKGQTEEAMRWLQKAAQLGPEDPRFGYVYAVALHDTGQTGQAIRALRTVLLRHPYDPEVLSALVSYEIETGDLQSAFARAKTLAALEPENDAVRRLLLQLRRGTK